MRYALVIAVLVLIAAPAHAQEMQHMGGDPLSYTTLGAGDKDGGGHLNYRALDYQQPAPKELQPIGADKTAPKTPGDLAADKAWEKYKELAAGTYKGDDDDKNPTDTGKQDTDNAVKPAVIKPDTDNAPTGLAGILQEYQRNKAQRSELHTIQVTPEAADDKNSKDKEKNKKEKKEED